MAARGARPPELSNAVAGGRYTARWHRVRDWATRELIGDVEDRPNPKQPRVAIVRGQWVTELLDDEEAESVAIDLAAPAMWLGEGLRGDVGGRRRVLIRVHTWILDTRAGVLYDPQWITTGEGLSLRAAAAAHNRYLRAYAQAVKAGVESRRLLATAQEIAWWTAPESVPYV